MKRAYFLKLESYSELAELELTEVIDQLGFDSRGLIPAITQDANTKEVLMLAWMNKEALAKTIATGDVTYWSWSRNQLWVKGETSGHTQELVSLSFDCDGDAVLCLVNQTGAACHTGRKNCFYLKVDNKAHKVHIVSSK